MDTPHAPEHVLTTTTNNNNKKKTTTSKSAPWSSSSWSSSTCGTVQRFATKPKSGGGPQPKAANSTHFGCGGGGRAGRTTNAHTRARE